MKRQSFLTGAVILMAANAVSKILGAVFKIPLTYIINEEGMAVYNTAFTVYIMFLSLVISGMPFAISKTVAQDMILKRCADAKRTVTLCTLILSAAGLFGTGALWLLAPYLADAMNEPAAKTAIRAISPSIFFVAVGAGYKSYFQGVLNMVPVALSQVIEALIKLAAGIWGAMLFVSYGTQKSVAGAISGVTVGEITASAMLFIFYIFTKKENGIRHKRDKKIIADILSVAIPFFAISVSASALATLDTAIIRRSLISSGIGASAARFFYGAYTGYAQTVFNLPIGIIATIGVSILPVIAGETERKNLKRTASITEFAIKLSIVLSVPCAVMMYVLSGEMLFVLFKNTTAELMLSMLAPCIIPISVRNMIIAIEQSAGKLFVPFMITTVFQILGIFMGCILIYNCGFGIYGAIIACIISDSMCACALFISILRIMRLKFKIMEIIIKPLVCGICMLISALILKERICPYIESALIKCVLVALNSSLLYAALLFLSGELSIKEIKRMRK